MIDYKALVKEIGDHIIEMRRDLHRIPEVAYTEEKTSAYIAERLTELGLDVKTKVAKYGVVGILDTGKPGKTLMFRADMDALPVTEETGLEFASEHEGRMHACGHDCHMAVVLGTAIALKKVKDQLSGVIKFVFQPAEEGTGGAKPMIEEGVMENPKVDYALGCHVWPGLPEGVIGIMPGTIMAAMNRFDLKIIGKQGHGAMPHLCVDSLEIATQVVNALQRVTSRQMSPLNPSVVTVGTFHAGTAFNVIPQEAVLSGTTRTLDWDIWLSWKERLEKIIKGVCESMGADYEFEFSEGYPPTINDKEMVEMITQCATEGFGQDAVSEVEPTMGGEDMSFFLEKAKGCYFFLGTGYEGAAGVHNPKFNPTESSLLMATEIFCRAAFKLLGQQK
jgi:amidohydrolase